MRLSDLFHKVESLDADEVRQMLSDDSSKVSLIDVREPAEYEKEHIPGAVLMPMSQIAGRISEVDKSRPVITY